jgi:hypothetical protein
MTDELHIGYYASLITSAFAMAQFVSGIPPPQKKMATFFFAIY